MNWKPIIATAYMMPAIFAIAAPFIWLEVKEWHAARRTRQRGFPVFRKSGIAARPIIGRPVHGKQMHEMH